MKRFLPSLLCLAATTAMGQGRLIIVATTPDLGALAQEIGRDRVEVKVLAKPTEDPHYVDPKPSHIVTLNRANALIEGGAELEIGWLPPLLESARNPRLALGTPGRIVASRGVSLLEIPTGPSSELRGKGDVHSLGNPHFLTDPLRAMVAARNIAAGLAKVDPASAELFQENLERLTSTVNAKLAEWQQLLSPFQGATIVTYHRDFSYFAERFGLEVVATIEPKPGIPPSPAHVAEVIQTVKRTQARVILLQPFQNPKAAETVARATGIGILKFPQQPGAAQDTAGYIPLMDYLVRTLAAALEKKQ